MENFPWVKNYPEGVPAEIKLYEYPSLVELFETSCKKFQDRVAFENMGVKMTYGEVDTVFLKTLLLIFKALG
jgi:long-chain acyl-CoA synthetase